MATFKTITFEEGSKLTQICSGAFENCDNVGKIELPNTVTSIGSYAFSRCEMLNTFKCSGNLTTIEERTFADCPRIIIMVLPKTLKEVYQNALENSYKAHIYFEGSDSEWGNVYIRRQWSTDQNELNATLYYYSEEKPSSAGKYWCYTENGQIKEWS